MIENILKFDERGIDNGRCPTRPYLPSPHGGLDER